MLSPNFCALQFNVLSHTTEMEWSLHPENLDSCVPERRNSFHQRVDTFQTGRVVSQFGVEEKASKTPVRQLETETGRQ